ncbi:hypothetical protein EB061_09825 [bacterium]|nr:hypothetical protein [bacterium]
MDPGFVNPVTPALSQPQARSAPGRKEVAEMSEKNLFLNRDLGWLEFNARVLDEALDDRTPLFERLRFLGIFQNNLDEYFMKRMGSLYSHARVNFRTKLIPLIGNAEQCFRKQLKPALKEGGIHLLEWGDLTEEERARANSLYQNQIFPVLTPFAVDSGHPFPFLSNLSISLGVTLRNPEREDETQFARLKVPNFFPQWIRVDASSGHKEPQDIMKSILETYSLQKGVRSGRYPSPADLPAFFEFPQIDQREFFRILKSSSRARLLPAIREQACRGIRRPYSGEAHAEMRLTGRRVFQRLNRALDRGEPISIDFFSGILERLTGYRRSLVDLHTVLIYGRKYNPETRECSYLMKNSYGTDCSRYDPRIPCDAGYLWFTERQLFPTLTSVVQVGRSTP